MLQTRDSVRDQRYVVSVVHTWRLSIHCATRDHAIVSVKIVLVGYDLAWPVLFQREAARIRGALAERARLVEHAGSTSVPGLAAKPRIDVVVAVPDSAAEGAYRPDLEAAGYRFVLREPDWHAHRLFKGPEVDVNLHVFTDGSMEIERMLTFRDTLRSNADERALYERAKRELAAREWETVQAYADAKSDVIEGILVRALGQRGAHERS